MLLQTPGRFRPGLRQGRTGCLGLFLRLPQLPFQVSNGVVSGLDGVQLPAAPVQIFQHVLHCGAVLLFQAVEQIAAAFQLIQFRRGEVKFLPLIPDQLRKVIYFTSGIFQSFHQFFQGIIQPLDPGEGLLRLAQQCHRAHLLVVSAEEEVGANHRGQELLPVPQDIPPTHQLLLFPGLELGPLQLVDLEFEGIHPPGLFRLVHLELADLAPQIGHGVIAGGIALPLGLQAAEPVQIGAVLLLVQQLLAVMLAVDIQKLPSDLSKLGHRHRAPVGPAQILSLGVELPLEQEIAVLIRLYTVG